MRWTIMTIFPRAFDSVLQTSLFGKARDKQTIEVSLQDIRDFAEDRHQVVDDAPFGGGPGMVMKVEPLAKGIEQLRLQDPAVHVILLSPQGAVLSQARVAQLARLQHIALICGRYEGVDERIRPLVNEELSIGDYVLAGGEPAAWVVMDSVSRLVPGVMGKEESSFEESFSQAGLLEYPQYTRPREFRGMGVPKVLLEGDHQAIKNWRRKQALLRTARRRPELLRLAFLSEEERAWLLEEEQKPSKVVEGG